MFALAAIFALVLCVWGGCLVARVVANRIEVGGSGAGRAKNIPTEDTASARNARRIVRRSAWWGVAGFMSLVIGACVAFLGSFVEGELNPPSFGRTARVGDSVTDALVIASVGLAAGLCVVGWRFDPARGRRRCPKCWYDLAGVNSGLCPECGRAVKSERELQRTRRSKGMLVFAALVLLSGPISSRVNMAMRFGAWGWMPTTVMILAWEWLPDESLDLDGVEGSLHQRLAAGELSGWQKELLLWRYHWTIRHSNDPRTILRASEFADSAVRSSEFDEERWKETLTAVASRLDFIIRELRSPDPERQQAAFSLAYDGSRGLQALVQWSDKPSEEYGPLLLSLIDTPWHFDNSTVIDLLWDLHYVPDEKGVSLLAAVLRNPANIGDCDGKTLGMLASAADSSSFVGALYKEVLASLVIGKKRTLLENSFAIVENPEIRTCVLGQLGAPEPEIIAGAVTALRYRREYHPLLIRTITERLDRDAKEIEWFITPLHHLTTQVAIGADREALVSLMVPRLLAGLEAAEFKAAVETLWYLRINEARTPEVLATVQAMLARPGVSESLQLHLNATLRTLFPPETSLDAGAK